MLRIVTVNEPSSTTLKLEGRLVSDWVAEAHRIWSEAIQMLNGKMLIVDMFGLTFVDDLGRDLLTVMHASGARLVGTGPMVAGLIEEIESEQAAELRSAFLKTISALLGIVLVLAIVGMPPEAWFQ